MLKHEREVCFARKGPQAIGKINSCNAKAKKQKTLKLSKFVDKLMIDKQH